MYQLNWASKKVICLFSESNISLPKKTYSLTPRPKIILLMAETLASATASKSAKPIMLGTWSFISTTSSKWGVPTALESQIPKSLPTTRFKLLLTLLG